MTHPDTSRKAVFLCAALLAASGLSACDNQNLGKTFAQIKAIEVDDSGQPSLDSHKKLDKKDVELVVRTAEDLAVGEGGLLKKPSQDGADKVQIAVVDPLQLPPANEPELDVKPEAGTAPQLRTEVTPHPVVTEVKPVDIKPVTAVAAGKTIQVGSFGSLASAQNAWRTLQAKYPGVEQFRPSYQSVTLASGKSMVRLKVGPVTQPGQAERLCSQLNIHDAWCARAS